MILGLRELRRRPGRFGVVGIALTLLVVLLLLLGGLLDGLVLGSTGAFRAQRADVFVYSADARESFVRSRVDGATRAAVERVDGVESVGGLGVVLLGARVPGEEEAADAAVIGYEQAPSGVPAPPAPGQAYADVRLQGDGVELGDVLELGPLRMPLEVVGFVEDTNYLLQGALWVEPGTWRAIQSASRPDQTVTDEVFQVLVVRGDGTDAATLVERIDEATGTTTSLTKDEALRSVPGTEEQSATFSLLIATTLFACGLVTALFFALLVIERLALFGTLKALGASSSRLVAGVVTQALVVAATAFAVGAALSFGLAGAAPAAIPLQLQPSRAVTSGVLLLGTAAVGAALSLRRITRIDPATAIGGGA